MTVTNMPIESLVAQTMNTISDDATKDLRHMVDKVDKNMAQKEELRKVQAKLELYKEAIRNGESYVAQDYKNDMIEALQEIGLTDANSAEGQMAASLPTWSGDSGASNGGGLSPLDPARRSQLGLPANAVAFETAAGYVIVFDDVNGGRRGKGESMQVFGPDNRELSQVWGDPHLWEGDGTKWDFTTDGDMVLPDGTLIKMDTTYNPNSGSHMSFLETVTIVSGDNKVEVTGISSNNAQAGSITNDGATWRENHQSTTAQAAGYSQFFMALEGDKIHYHAMMQGTEQGIVSGSRYDSSLNRWVQDYSSTQEARDKMLSGAIKSFETLLDHRAQSMSDLGQKLQFQLQEMNNIMTRANKGMSDIQAKYDQSLNGVSQNLKG